MKINKTLLKENYTITNNSNVDVSQLENIVARFYPYVKEKLKPASGKIPRTKHSDLDRFEKYVHPWDKHCQEQDNIPF